jgi:hypothetical protein
MTDPTPPSTDQSQSGGVWHRQFLIAAALLLAFGVLVGFMLVLADTTKDAVWQRRIYLFSAVQAIVFTAVGWLFGREVNRSAAESARQEVSTARQNETAARVDARTSAEQASRAEQEAAAERARGEVVAAVLENTQPAASTENGQRPSVLGRSQEASAGRDATPGPAGTVIDLRGLMRDVYGSRDRGPIAG